MVRAFIKGGVWKNSEDEILKAAVQKYGKQQWARVASLLNRKTAKQCKARWHEWLDPSVRKVEWSREEEEKLLHLAKLMPAQWKTIGPLVGRTATQCQEHYEKLLDEAAAASGKVSGEDETAGATADIRQQPLRVGQIDSHPETKPARPDPIDMDEDEIEMLQEARARLANTQGKKAKRKAREKMLAQAKRMADLQKRRELKQAGLISGQAKKKARRRLKGGDIDLGIEIPFHKQAPAGFHDVSQEVVRSEVLRAKQAKRVDFQKLNEQQYRSRDEEQQKAKKREESRLRALEKSNMDYVVAQVSKTNDPLNIRKRGPLSLPAPSLSDRELQTLAKMEEAATTPAAIASTSKGATSTLLADYSDRPLPTPMRTPAVASGVASSGESKQKSIMREASNLRMLERGQTPLLGGENPLLEERLGEADDGTAMDGKPRARPMTPGGPSSAAAVTRDHFGLNQRPQSESRGGFADDGASVGASTFATSTTAGMLTAASSIRDLARAERRAAKRARRELEEALAALPAPQFEYELEAPTTIGDDDHEGKVETVMEEDMADVDAEEKRRLQEEADKLYEARSSVVKRRDLPRPVGVPPDIKSLSETGVSDQSVAEALIDEERLTLLKHDAFAFPVETPLPFLGSGEKKGKKKKKKQDKTESFVLEATHLEPISEAALDAAKELIQLEYDRDLNERSQSLLPSGNTMDQAMRLVLAEMSNSAKENPSSRDVFVSNKWKDSREDNALLAESLAQEFETIEEATSALHKRNEKLESKLALLTGGFAKRAKNTSAGILNLHRDMLNACIELGVYKKLSEQEELGAVSRIDRLQLSISKLKEDEERLKSLHNSLLAH
ncbi:unnamed protein product [Pseudo-nitzschia multistriata]|uniref:Uncharacterized protein n=1 Tax=Pseudo-nitzschia multistriata TaxID=183589 RepID=A0A448ZJ84_9STRA|nr:unnamed protein product [Pseudo-nitzschia multistriata]